MLQLVPALALVIACHSAAFAEINLEIEAVTGRPIALFADGMVLQRDAVVPVWGRASAGEPVTVTFDGQTRSTTTGSDGLWQVELDPLVAGGPHQMTIEGTNTIVISDVLVGDVWICAGQSNMAIRRAGRTTLQEYPDIRTLGRRGQWHDRPSGIALAFAREIQAEIGVPIGIINRAAGGTPIRTWLAPAAADDADPEVQSIVGAWSSFGDQYTRHIRPFAGYAIRGVVFWQGEQDLKLSRQEIGSVEHYYHLLPALIRSWRSEWQSGDLPFVFVQLPTGGGLQIDQTASPLPPSPPEPDIATLMRRATFNGLAEPATALTVSIDIEGGVHPKNREMYAHRIANAALGTAYGQVFAYSGPVYSSASLESAGRVRLAFKPGTADGLKAVGGPLQGFAISDDGETFVWAEAGIEGSEVVVWNDAIAAPTVVRYGWSRLPTWANLFNGDNLGAAPFSTTESPAP
ncbi:MAG: sialate O-acetylesterase [Candidatus Binatia bacterium]